LATKPIRLVAGVIPDYCRERRLLDIEAFLRTAISVHFTQTRGLACLYWSSEPDGCCGGGCKEKKRTKFHDRMRDIPLRVDKTIAYFFYFVKGG
jgi:hypothetical protein